MRSFDDQTTAPAVPDPDAVQLAEDLIRQHGPVLLRYLRMTLRDRGLADDAFSLTLEWIWKGAAGFRGEAVPRTWAFAIAWSAARRLREDPWAWRRTGFVSEEASKLASELRTASTYDTQQKQEHFAELRRELDADEQNLLVLRIEEGLDWQEIAEILSANGNSVSAVAVRKRFERLKERIRKLAKRRGFLR